MKRVFCIALIALVLLACLGCSCDYTRVCRVCYDLNGRQVLVDEFGEAWEVIELYPNGTDVELTIREGGIFDDYADDRIVSVRILYVPMEGIIEEPTVIAPLLGY